MNNAFRITRTDSLAAIKRRFHDMVAEHGFAVDLGASSGGYMVHVRRDLPADAKTRESLTRKAVKLAVFVGSVRQSVVDAVVAKNPNAAELGEFETQLARLLDDLQRIKSGERTAVKPFRRSDNPF